MSCLFGATVRFCAIGRGSDFDGRTETGVTASKATVAEGTHLRSDRRDLSIPRVIACCGSMVIVAGLERLTFETLRVLKERGAAVHCVVNSWENHRIVALA